ncbi:NAD(P)-binding domain-containing protein [Streptomyces sp. RY43-2]|uniref:NAD(P)-binding domain-containing protein n=1 Tax=Streptomyces macrolidinus TaxID=2952607 RepID=A0ABT0ZE92_9ACTN|nr:NAD(P)-binding domain-containing protein [Streptomyces macrolidinus]MCN9241881.1 NAD(P)-binding domain-containing protein [Streptomyces macrolidinus]
MTAVVPAVGVVGAGAVGQTVGGALVAAGLSDRLLVVSRTPAQAAALADDLDDMRAALGSSVLPTPATVDELRHCPAFVVAVRAQFTNDRSRDVRMAGVQANAPAVRALAAQMRGYQGTVLMVTNPVDLMTRLFAEESGCPRVFGIGSNLDSARYRLTLARLLDVPVAVVRGHVIGEHGDSAVVCASSTTVNGHPVPVPLQEVRDELAGRPGRISAGIGRTRCGPAGAVVSALRLALGAEDGMAELSVPYREDCCGIPLRFTSGRHLPFLPPLDDTEARQLEAARTKLRAAYQAMRGIPSQSLPSGRNS